MGGRESLILPHGGYRRLRSFQAAQAVYDGTVVFCERFVERSSRTRDQMVQAARSGVQNIAEGSVAPATSKKSELKLTNVVRASLEELLLDYEDFLRQRGLRIWPKDSSEALAVRRRLSTGAGASGRSDKSDGSDKSDESDKSDGSDESDWRTMPAEAFANTMICLVNQASYLLRRQLQRLEQDFLASGGFTERLYQQRRACREDGAPRRPEKRR